MVGRRQISRFFATAVSVVQAAAFLCLLLFIILYASLFFNIIFSVLFFSYFFLFLLLHNSVEFFVFHQPTVAEKIFFSVQLTV